MDVDTGNVGDNNPQPSPPDISIDPNEIPSLNNPIYFA
ncbi:uncharacterized protein N7479_010192 [Penicillium vulpinum]|nr:uncharacterized protein N7479_010192 [Penicillium vulpinum]KAJ5951779.1 hypothetical protein N7479_010192 [Penicillium vulpinum]